MKLLKNTVIYLIIVAFGFLTSSAPAFGQLGIYAGLFGGFSDAGKNDFFRVGARQAIGCGSVSCVNTAAT